MTRFDREIARATTADMNMLQIERLIDRLILGTLEVLSTTRRGGNTTLTFTLDGQWTVTLRSYWPRTVTVGALRRVEWRDDIGWICFFDVAATTNLDDDGVQTGPNGDTYIRLIGHRLHVSHN